MSNVNSDDPGRDGAVETSPGSLGGAARVEQSREEVTGRRIWPVLGTAVVALLLLMPVVWIIVQIVHVTGLGNSSIVWLYASAAVFIGACLVWFLFRVLGSRAGRG